MKKINNIDLHGYIAKWNQEQGFPLTIPEVYDLYKKLKERGIKDGRQYEEMQP